jgi:hypothetical protein
MVFGCYYFEIYGPRNCSDQEPTLYIHNTAADTTILKRSDLLVSQCLESCRSHFFLFRYSISMEKLC